LKKSTFFKKPMTGPPGTFRQRSRWDNCSQRKAREPNQAFCIPEMVGRGGGIEALSPGSGFFSVKTLKWIGAG
jgi:hypothetical protein